jgi:hypothetical protein
LGGKFRLAAPSVREHRDQPFAEIIIDLRNEAAGTTVVGEHVRHSERRPRTHGA